jgi:hypothetical protein
MSDAYTAAAEANARQITVKATFNGNTELTGDHIIDISVTEATNASGGLSMGATISSKLTMNLKMPEEPLLLTGGYIEPFVGYYGIADYCPLGKFYITDVVSNDDFKTVTITAYDGFSKLEKPYTPTISMPATAEDILNDIANQHDFKINRPSAATLPTVENGVLTYSPIPTVADSGVMMFSGSVATDNNGVLAPVGDAIFPAGVFDLYDFTCRQYIGYFAGLMGKNARFNRNGELAFVWYTDSGHRINRDLQYISGFKRLTDTDFVVKSISSGSANNTLVAGNGAGISFDNPFMTQEILDGIFARIGVLSYTPAHLKWRGNPAVEAGDIVLVEDKNGSFKTVYVMEQTFKISGGMYSEIKCYGDSEAAINFDTSPTSKKIRQVYTQLQEAIKNATELLNGNNGGVFEVTDGNGDGINDGWIIHSADGQKFIKATIDGIGITTDGGATYKQAITSEGINASTITAGSLNAERIAVENYDENNPTKLTDYIRFGDGTITLGKGDSAIILKLENDQIAFYNTNGTRLGRFTNNSFEIDNLEDGQIRFQNFGFIPRASKNLSFTKLK